ncbi:MAG TPA: hypothetical protein VM240_09050 [Verrucomicrobiae bacterium]|nr:hypothetical protein [Verrucomicrobiae bacterium]
MKAGASWAAGAALCASLGLGLPVFAQDEEPTESIPVEESPTVDTVGEGTTPEAESAPVEEVPAEAAAEETPTEEAPAEEVAEESTEETQPGEPLALYAGIDMVRTTLSLSSSGSGGANELDSGMYRARVGWRALEAVGLELQYGVDNSDDEPGSVETQDYMGAYVVPTATLFEVVELAFPVGYAKSSYGKSGSSQGYSSIAFGVDGELPLRSFGAALPDIRLTAGWMVYYQKSDARAYGANVGLRYDFSFGRDSAPAE